MPMLQDINNKEKMEAAITRLCESIGELLQYYPLVLRNDFQSSSSAGSAVASSSTNDALPNSEQPTPKTSIASSTHDVNRMADAVEGFLTELTRATSIGLREGDGFELWSVLELLECVPGRMQAEAEAKVEVETRASARCSPSSPVPAPKATISRSPASLPPRRGDGQTKATTFPALSLQPTAYPAPAFASARPSRRRVEEDGASWWQHPQRFRFASQLVYVVRSTFPAAPRPLKARMLLRLALNQGCLLASLELLRLWCRNELEGFYEPMRGPPHAETRTLSAASKGGPCVALLTQPETDSDVWNSFVAAIAPVSGPPVTEIAAGAPRVTPQPFNLQLLVAGLDDDSVASLEYYTQLQCYVQGRRSIRPSALACYEASQRRSAHGADASAVAHTMLSLPGAASAASQVRRNTSALPTQQHVLQVEALPTARPTVVPRSDCEAVHHENGSVADTSSQSSSLSARRRLRRCRKKRVCRRGADCDGGVGEGVEAATELGGDEGLDNGVGRLSVSSPPLDPLARHERCHGSSSSVPLAADDLVYGGESAPQQSPLPSNDFMGEGEASGTADRTNVDAESTLGVPSAGSTEPAAAARRVSDTASRVSVHDTEDDRHDEAALQRTLHAIDEGSGRLSTTTEANPQRQPEASSSLPPQLVALRARALQCWAVAVAHAESQERKRLSARDADAYDATITQ
ncbi:hypothetical protein ABL78_1692 [Leptomonas seymouri]|uniref:Uncharacterized protein n=1 Tax=Leptomonas seymouri TaxID=5684 RepID=A0A0N0P7U6_LEPSE|nr:hypothetical protein ABL78_1692 [Leptomonas seymouri]|eukprot:KPI89199.1 hypothetical protein ABL78_1692 [Leptomonas seymouri]